MRARGLARHLPLAITALLVLLLSVLAALQWRWIGEVSDMERQRMRASLTRAGGHFAEDFDREVARIFLFFHPELSAGSDEQLARVVRQYERWQAEAPYPELVRDVFLVRGGDEPGNPALAVLRPRQRRFEPCPWPAELAQLHGEASRPPGLRAGFWGMVPAIRAEVPGLLIPLNFHAPPEDSATAGRLDGSHLLVRLDTRAVSGEIFPTLTRRYFDNARGGEYALAVMDSAAGRTVFLSDPQVPASAFGAGDLRLDILRLRPFEELHALGPRHARRRHLGHPAAEIRLRRGAMPHVAPWHERGAWTLVIKHRDGSLEAAVAHIRLHNLGISLGILALLAATAGMLLVTTQRAQRLARQQIEFVAGVTHELNTPLTAVRSAGQNLADGVVSDPSQVRRYGALIAKEGRRLSDMVAQALELAGIQSGRRIYHLRPVEVAEIVDGALQDSRWLLQEKSIEVERAVEPDLPAVLADAAALRRAVQNLVENAVKHGGAGGWIGVRARHSGSGQVEITVADRGPGIAAEDLPHLFEPFFRGRNVAAGNIPGSGLGLSLVRHIAEAHGGRIAVDSVVGQGSAFTLRLPAASAAAAVEAVEEPA